MATLAQAIGLVVLTVLVIVTLVSPRTGLLLILGVAIVLGLVYALTRFVVWAAKR